MATRNAEIADMKIMHLNPLDILITSPRVHLVEQMLIRTPSTDFDPLSALCKVSLARLKAGASPQTSYPSSIVEIFYYAQELEKVYERTDSELLDDLDHTLLHTKGLKGMRWLWITEDTDEQISFLDVAVRCGLRSYVSRQILQHDDRKSILPNLYINPRVKNQKFERPEVMSMS